VRVAVMAVAVVFVLGRLVHHRRLGGIGLQPRPGVGSFKPQRRVA
jgi:hypothetical protein